VTAEPLYTFVRGQGWVLSPVERSETFQFRDGVSAYFEFRRPEIGEYYDGADVRLSTYFPEGKPDWHRWLYDYKHKTSHSLHLTRKEGTRFHSSDLYVTLVFV
jgi:hypothetical protein